MIAILLAAFALNAQMPPSESAPAITGAEFLAIDARNAQAPPVATTRIPHRPGSSCYAWVITVEPHHSAITIREVFELPAPAEQWGTSPMTVTAVTADRSRAVTQLEESLDDGLLSNSWCVADGDPTGAHRIRVYVGERLLHQFDFDVVAETY